MSFSPLETILISFSLSLLTGVSVRLLFSSKFVTRDQCGAERQKLCIEREILKKELGKLQNGQRIQFKMLRSISVHLDVPTNVKSEILNED